MAGEYQGTRQGQHMKGRTVHTHHVGYDLYTCGPPNQQQVRAILRSHQVPDRVGTDVRDMLPYEFRWPTGNHQDAWLAIDALLLVDVANIESLIRQYSGHHFGFETWVDKARRWRSAAHQHGSSDLPDVRATDGPQGANTRPRARSFARPLFPGWVKHAEPLDPIVLDQITLRRFVVYFSNDVPGLRIDVYPNNMLVDRSTRLTRIHADLATNRSELVEHYPGRYLILGLDPRMLQPILHVKGLGTQRRTIYDHPDVLATRERARLRAEENGEPQRARSLRIVGASRAMSLAADPDGDPEHVFGPHFLPAPGAPR